MDIHQLKTFVVVAREGSITRAAERLYLSQPAVSAHIKAIEETLGLPLFERTARGMSLTAAGQRLLTKAEQTLSAHRDLVDEATRIKGNPTGRLRLGSASSVSKDALGSLLTGLFERLPDVQLALTHGTSVATLEGIRSGALDAGLYNDAGRPDAELTAFEVSRFAIYVAAPRKTALNTRAIDWRALAELPWIYPPASTCCGRAAENLFEKHGIRPRQTISIDRESVTRTLIAGDVGVGFLHVDTARDAEACGEVQLVCMAQDVRLLFAFLTSRAEDPLLSAVTDIVRVSSSPC